MKLAMREAQLTWKHSEQVDPLDQFVALKAAVTRVGDPLSPHSPARLGAPFNTTSFPGRKLSREEAVRAATIQGAKFLRVDNSIGSLETGKLADMIVTEKNYFEMPEEEIARNKVLMTMLGGEVLYIANHASFGNVTAKFPNNPSDPLNAKNIGGFGGHKRSPQAEATRLKYRRDCHAFHSHHHH
jgi:hypothetical protein